MEKRVAKENHFRQVDQRRPLRKQHWAKSSITRVKFCLIQDKNKGDKYKVLELRKKKVQWVWGELHEMKLEMGS